MSETNLRFHGDAPFRVAVVHGGPGAAGDMVPVARRLATHCGVLEPHQTARTIAGQVEELRDIICRNARIPAVLIGHSWGAWLSLLVAAQHPALVEKLILVSSGPFTEAHADTIRARRLARLDEGQRVEYETTVARLRGLATPDTHRLLTRLRRLTARSDAYAPLSWLETLREHARPVEPNSEIYQAVWSEASEMRRRGGLMRRARFIKCPVVAIHGDSDPHPAIGVSEPLSTTLADFRFVTLERCGHIPWLERYAKKEFYRVLLAEIG